MLEKEDKKNKPHLSGWAAKSLDLLLTTQMVQTQKVTKVRNGTQEVRMLTEEGRNRNESGLLHALNLTIGRVKTLFDLSNMVALLQVSLYIMQAKHVASRRV